jgi:NAD(P)-dependent dehydrogenase (short-subunit alcohol dehydrogenase family)
VILFAPNSESLTGAATNPENTLAKRVALITGAGTGIGAETAKQLAKHGVRIVAHYYKSETGVREVVNEIRQAGGNATEISADLSSPDAVRQLAQDANLPFGPIDILVNNAGYHGPKTEPPPADVVGSESLAQWTRGVNVNVMAPFGLMTILGGEMFSRGWGRIINVSAASSLRFKGPSAMVMVTKSALASLTGWFARQYAPSVTVNAVAPGIIETETIRTREKTFPSLFEQYRELIPGHEFGKPLAVATTIEYLASPAANYVTGQIINIDGGLFLK